MVHLNSIMLIHCCYYFCNVFNLSNNTLILNSIPLYCYATLLLNAGVSCNFFVAAIILKISHGVIKKKDTEIK